MMKLFGSNRLAFLISCLIAILLLFGYNANKNSYSNITRHSLAMVVPMEKYTSSVAYFFSDLAGDISSFFTGFKENKRLKIRNDHLEQYYHLYKQLYFENQQLRKELHFTAELKHKYITARIIARNNTASHQQITIEAGEKDGLKKWQMALLHNQIIGRVIEVFDNTAIILLLSDKDSGIPVITSQTKNKFIAAGMATNYLSCKYLNKHTELTVGELAITSGDELNMLPNLIVGTVFKEENNFYLKPTVEFDKLEFVHIVLQ